ncbi:MAG: hypothetical protein K5756_01370 [Clostridiales bacterium]|nr:hypothetical protein [Clostridiales bacterium]
MLTVRPYLIKDYSAVRQICLDTAVFKRKTEVSKKILVQTECDYYAECEPYNCFVAVDENDVPKGYALCCENFSTFKQKFTQKYVPSIAQISFFSGVTAKGYVALYKMFAGYYPAHMHMHILKEYDTDELRDQLMDTLTEHLRSRDGRGLLVYVYEKDKDALRYYEDYGFNILRKTSGYKLLGLDLI